MQKSALGWLGFTKYQEAKKDYNAMFFLTLSLNKKVKQHLLFRTIASNIWNVSWLEQLFES